jgi:uncharacterized protein (DUF983 family)
MTKHWRIRGEAVRACMKPEPMHDHLTKADIPMILALLVVGCIVVVLFVLQFADQIDAWKIGYLM